MLIIIQNSSYNWVKGESELNQGWINGEKTLCCFRTTEPKILSFSTLTFIKEKPFICFLFKTFFHTVLRRTCWKWVDTSTLIQLITFNCYSTSIDNLWKLIEILQHLKRGWQFNINSAVHLRLNFTNPWKLVECFNSQQCVEDHLSLQRRFNSHGSTIFQPM